MDHNKEYTNADVLLSQEDNYKFMNHGYYPPYPKLINNHKKFKHQCSLYLSLVKNLNLNDKNILDIGCGKGGGIEVYNTYLNSVKLVGCDLNTQNINFCKKNYSYAKFYQCDAQSLIFKDNSFDIVTNVESSHCYLDKTKFYKEVKRVLKPKGLFLYTDLIDSTSFLPEVLLPLKNIFKNVNVIDITKNVKEASYQDVSHFEKNIKNKQVQEFSISIAKTAFQLYKKGKTIYYSITCSN